MLLDSVYGRIVDTDSHEWVTVAHFEREFGPDTAALAAMIQTMAPDSIVGQFLVDVERDDAPIDPATIHHVKGPAAPGAMDMRHRLKVLDAMGIDRQLIFGTGPGIFGPILVTTPMDRLTKMMLTQMNLAAIDNIEELAREWGRLLCTAHNDWCIRVAAIDERLHPVAVLAPTSLDETLAELQRLIDGGVRAILMPADTPPAGFSPADVNLDPFWRLCADANIAVLLHIGSQLNFMTSSRWADVPIFEDRGAGITEVPLDPYTLSTVHMSAQNFLTTKVLGGVFERHPNLRFGVIELTSHWVGPMVENMTHWVDEFAKRMSGFLSLSPIEYLQRNVRVTSFPFERVDRYIERYGLEDVYTFGSDYPHYEGGIDPASTFAERLSGLGPSAIEKFFVTNGELLLPRRSVSHPQLEPKVTVQ